MDRKAVLFTGLSLILCANAVEAADHLTDVQLDKVTAGQVLGIDCAGCTLASSNSASANGITTSTSSVTGTGSLPATGGGGNSGGGSNNGGGSSNGGGGSAPAAPGIGTPVPIPGNLASIIKTATTVTPSF